MSKITTPAHLGAHKSEVATGLAWAARFLSGSPELTAELCAAWTVQLSESGVESEFIAQAFVKHCARSRFWPSPCEIIECARIVKRERFDAAKKAAETKIPIEAKKPEMLTREQRDAMKSPRLLAVIAKELANGSP